MKNNANFDAEFKNVLKKYPHEHLFSLLNIHLESSTMPEQVSSKKGTVFKRTFDDVMEIYIKNCKNDDAEIQEIKFENGEVPLYLPINEILEIFKKDFIKKEIIAELSSPLVIVGNQKLGDCHFISQNEKFYVKTYVYIYDESFIKNSRNKFELGFINKEIKEKKIYYICKLLSLELCTHFEYKFISDIKFNNQFEDLKKTKLVFPNGARYFHNAEQVLNTKIINELLAGFEQLNKSDCLKLKRALYWVEKFRNQSESDSLLYISILIEALSDSVVLEECSQCGQKKYSSGMTELFKDFIFKYSTLDKSIANKYAEKMYEARSRIVHDGKLLYSDDPAMKLKEKFFLLNDISSPKYNLSEWILNWINDQLKKNNYE